MQICGHSNSCRKSCAIAQTCSRVPLRAFLVIINCKYHWHSKYMMAWKGLADMWPFTLHRVLVNWEGTDGIQNIPGRPCVLKAHFTLLDTYSLAAPEASDTRLYIWYENLYFVHLEVQTHALVRVFTSCSVLTGVWDKLWSQEHISQRTGLPFYPGVLGLRAQQDSSSPQKRLQVAHSVCLARTPTSCVLSPNHMF